MSKPAIALYLGETYATIGLFDISEKSKPSCLVEKTVFLPQVSLKNLLNQLKTQAPEHFSESGEAPIPTFVVTRYLDRLKQFRLGGSISQVILKGFENSYTLKDSKSLSLAAAQLIIQIESPDFDEAFLAQELERVKKINPDLNKIVISIPEDKLSSEKREILYNFFSAAGLKIFTCSSPTHQSQLRKTLLNAGSEGTKEEIITDLKEGLSPRCEVAFFTQDGFQQKFENCELFNSANNFLARFIQSQKASQGAFFDIESLKFIDLQTCDQWQSPWGSIPVLHYRQADLSLHPFTEVKLNHLSLLQIEAGAVQLEPGPVVSGRAIRPLILDLFYQELQNNEFAATLFAQLKLETLRAKIANLFSVLEKGQKNPELTVPVEELKKLILKTVENEIEFQSGGKDVLLFGPLTKIFAAQAKGKYAEFSWPQEILRLALTESNVGNKK